MQQDRYRGTDTGQQTEYRPRNEVLNNASGRGRKKYHRRKLGFVRLTHIEFRAVQVQLPSEEMRQENAIAQMIVLA